jgi:hypothetical protein
MYLLMFEEKLNGLIEKGNLCLLLYNHVFDDLLHFFQHF